MPDETLGIKYSVDQYIPRISLRLLYDVLNNGRVVVKGLELDGVELDEENIRIVEVGIDNVHGIQRIDVYVDGKLRFHIVNEYFLSAGAAKVYVREVADENPAEV